jgi:hypothetical protein
MNHPLLDSLARQCLAIREQADSALMLIDVIRSSVQEPKQDSPEPTVTTGESLKVFGGSRPGE